MNATEIKKTISSAFANYIGQGQIVKNRIDAHSAWTMGNDSPYNLFVAGHAGLGKSALLVADLEARRMAAEIRYGREALTKYIATPQDFRRDNEEYLSILDALEGGDGICFDEFQEFSIRSTVKFDAVRGAIKRLADGNQGPLRTAKISDEMTISRHCSEIYFSAGSNQLHKIKDLEAILSRFSEKVAQLELYNLNELVAILQKFCKKSGIRIEEGSLKLVADCSRGVARPLEHIVAYLAQQATLYGKATANREDVLSAIRAMGLYPLGASKRELQILIRARGGLAMRILPVIFATDEKDIRGDVSFLASQGFVSWDGGRIAMTSKGADYLIQLTKCKFTIPA